MDEGEPMLTEIKTAADMLKLPFYIRTALAPAPVRSHRHLNNIERASRKKAIQVAVVRGIREGAISVDLGREILVANSALGPKGKKALADAQKGGE